MVQIKELFRRKDFLLLAVILIIFIFGIVYFLISINQESLMEKYISELVDKGLKVDAEREYKA
jgi:preprotein translocase subunit YajC